jgi:hypothetical protein
MPSMLVMILSFEVATNMIKKPDSGRYLDDLFGIGRSWCTVKVQKDFNFSFACFARDCGLSSGGHC